MVQLGEWAVSLESRVSFGTNILLGIAALLVIGRVTVDVVTSHDEEAPWAVVGDIPDWQTLVSGGRTIIPSTSPQLSVVVFSDFECPFCRKFQRLLEEVAPGYPEMTVVFRHFPLEGIHQNARSSANAAECAHAQGQFIPFHDLLFSIQDSIGDLPWDQLAESAGVPDLGEFMDCVGERRFDSLVSRDAGLAASFGFSSAPTVIINGAVHRGSPPDTTVLHQTLRRALDDV
jgi:protein-disulfide isomerase